MLNFTRRSVVLLACAPLAAQADVFQVDSPDIGDNKGKLLLESANRFDQDHRRASNGFREHETGLAYGVTSWWQAEVDVEPERIPGTSGGYTYGFTQMQNIFQFTRQDSSEKQPYWLSSGIELTYEHAGGAHIADNFQPLLLLERKQGPVDVIFNAGPTWEFGPGRKPGTDAGLAFSASYQIIPELSPGFEWFSDFGKVGHMGTWSNQQHQIGPVLYGRLWDRLNYEVGYLFGVSHAAPDGSLKLGLEYEIPL